jgi:hypothetical protein
MPTEESFANLLLVRGRNAPEWPLMPDGPAQGSCTACWEASRIQTAADVAYLPELFSAA